MNKYLTQEEQNFIDYVTDIMNHKNVSKEIRNNITKSNEYAYKFLRSKTHNTEENMDTVITVIKAIDNQFENAFNNVNETYYNSKYDNLKHMLSKFDQYSILQLYYYYTKQITHTL